MLGSIKALIFVLAISATVFHFSRPIAMNFMSGEDFARRRFVWIVLTITYFVSPNFWIYALVAVPVLLRANRDDSNPVALYLWLLHVIAPVGANIPILGNNGLFALDNYRILALFVLLPAIIRYRKSPEGRKAHDWGAMDAVLLAYGILIVALYTPPDLPHHSVLPDSASNMLRRAVLFMLDIYLLYFAVSRTCQTRRKMVEAAASFCLGCAVMGGLAIFENLRGWLLYTDIASRWGNEIHAGFYLMRGGSVRAQVSAGHSIALGYLLAVAYGFWLYLGTHVENGRRRIAVTLLLWGGLYATTSRGAWLGAATIYFTFLAAGTRAVSRVMKGTVLAIAIGGAVIVSPLGDRIMDMIPEIGKPADPYRHLLAERGWDLVLAHPLFGDHFPWPEMEDLRQGEGIIDIVNTYLGVGLSYGLTGLFLFVGFILIGTAAVHSRSKELASTDPDLALFGTSLIACVAGLLVMIDSNSFGLGSPKMFYMLAGLTAAYAKADRLPRLRRAALGVFNARRD